MKIHWKKYIILIGVATSVYGMLAVSAVQFNPYLFEYPTIVGAINYYRTATQNPGDDYPGQSIGKGWRNFGNDTFDVLTPEYCKTITVNNVLARDIFIPTRTSLEWDAFKTSNALTTFGVSISSCASLPQEGCDILSGTVCGSNCPPGQSCLNDQMTFDNQCDMILSEYHLIGPGACMSTGPCNPDSGPVSGGEICDPLKDAACIDIIPPCVTFENECAREAAGFGPVCGGGGGGSEM